MRCWSVRSNAELLATPLLHKDRGEPGGILQLPSGGDGLARDGPLGLVVMAGVMADWSVGSASALPRPQIMSSPTVNTTLAANCWPWVQKVLFLLVLTLITIKGLPAIPEG